MGDAEPREVSSVLPAGRNKQESLAARQAALVARAAAAVTAATEPDEVASHIVDQVMALGACAATLFVIETEGRSLRLLAQRKLSPEIVERLQVVPIDTPLVAARAARSGCIEVLEGVCASQMYPSLQRDLVEHTGCKSIVGVPLRVRDCLLGVVGWSLPIPHHFTDEDRATFAAIAEVFAVSLDRAATRAREQRLRAQVEAVRESALDLSGAFELRVALQHIVDRARELARAEYAALGIYAADGESFNPWVASGEDLSWARNMPHAPRASGLFRAVHAANQPLRVRDITQDPRFEGLPPGHTSMKSFLGVPILHLGRSMGDLFLSNKIGAVEFSEEDQLAMTLLAQHAAIAVERARVYERMVEELGKRRRIEEALRKSEQRFRAIFDWTFQMAGLLSPEGILLEVNRAFLSFFGLLPKQIIGRPFWEIPGWTKDARSRLRVGVAKAALGHFVREELEVLRVDGRMAWIDFSLKPMTDERGQVSLIIPEGREITQRKQDEAALREGEERFRLTIENAPIGMAIVGLDGRFVRVNQVFCEIVGYSAEEMCRLRFQDITHPEDLDTDLHLAQQLRHGEIPRYKLAKRYIRKDGESVPIVLHAAILRDTEGEPLYYISQVEDATEREEFERMREEWTSIVAHDLRQPISVIVFYAALLANDPSSAPKAQHIQASASKMNRMIEDLLDVSRLESHRMDLRLSKVALSKLIAAVVERTEGLTSGHPILFEPQGELPTLWADPDRLEQVLGNLLSNAAKYGKPETPIRVKVEKKDSEVIVAVSNEGQGIEPEEMPKLFSRFKRTDRAKKGKVSGLGLGLYICKGLIEAHKGRIWAESVQGKTTTFFFALPISQQV